MFTKRDRNEIREIRHAFGGGFILQIIVLHLKEICADALRCANVHQSPQELTLLVFIRRNPHFSVFRSFPQKRLNQKLPPLRLVHGQNLFSITCLGQISAHRPQ